MVIALSVAVREGGGGGGSAPFSTFNTFSSPSNSLRWNSLVVRGGYLRLDYNIPASVAPARHRRDRLALAAELWFY